MSNLPKEVREAMARAIDPPAWQVGRGKKGGSWEDRQNAARRIADAALSALGEAGYELNPKGTAELLADAGFALSVATDVSKEAHARWDGDMRAGKLLIAMHDPSLRYRIDITSFHTTKAKIDAALNAAMLSASQE